MSRKRWLLIVLMPMLAGILQGCTMLTNPTALVSHPQLPGDQQALQQIIQPFLPAGARLTVPLESPAAGAIRQVDLRGAGEATGLLVFYTGGSSELELGLIILENLSDKWVLRGHIRDTGKWFDRCLVTDLSADGVPELLLGYGGESSWAKMLAIYQLQDDTYELTARLAYVDLAVGRLDDNKTYLGILESSASAAYLSKVTLYEHGAGVLTTAYSTAMEGYPGAIIFGQATAEKRAVFVDLGFGAHSGRTVIVAINNGEIDKALEATSAEQELISWYKPHMIECTDINQDGLIEIGTELEAPGNQAAPPTYLEAWYQWDGAEGLQPVLQAFASYPDYRLILPERWHGQVAMIEESNTEEDMMVAQFSAYSPGRSNSPFLTIMAMPKYAWPREESKLKAANTPYILVGERENRLVIAVFPVDKQALGAKAALLLPTAEELKANLHVLP